MPPLHQTETLSHTPLHRTAAFDVMLALALGAAHSIAFSYTSMWVLQMACVAGLAWQVSVVTPRRAALLGWLFGTAWLVCSTGWLFISMYRYGGLPATLAALAVLLLCSGLAIYIAVAMMGFAHWRSRQRVKNVSLFTALWLLAEIARGWVFTGFPWAASGYAHVDGPLATLAPWTGVYGVGAVAAGLGAWLGLSTSQRDRGVAALVIVVMMVALKGLGPGQFTQPTSTLRVSLLQGNVAQNEKFQPELLPNELQWTQQALLSATGDLVVAPETVIPLLPEQLDTAYWQSLLDHFQQGTQAVLLGLPLGNSAEGYTNSVAGVSVATRQQPGGIYRYDKYHLVPFGEFIPTGFKWFTRLMNIPLGDFNRGSAAPPAFKVGPERVSPTICYEDLFGEELAVRFQDASDAPTLLANLSNMGWFGQSTAVGQHLHIARMRSLEFQRATVRATNTGATVVIDHTGHVTHALEPHTRGVLEGAVQGRTGLTPFARWAGVTGLWPLVMLATLMVVHSAVARLSFAGKTRSG